MKLLIAGVVMVPLAARADDFVTLDRQSATSAAGAEVSYLFPKDSSSGSTITVIRLDAHGQYVDPDSGFGGYVEVPYGRVSGDGQSLDAFGDIEAGAIYAPKLSDPNLGIT